MDNEFHEELNIENDGESYFAETPFLKSFEPIFTLKDQHGEKLRFICNRCPSMDDSGKFNFLILIICYYLKHPPINLHLIFAILQFEISSLMS